MQTTFDIDEALLSRLEQQARQQGRTLDSLLELALRDFVCSSAVKPVDAPQNNISEGLADDDPFFGALDEIRALGRLPAAHRLVKLP